MKLGQHVDGHLVFAPGTRPPWDRAEPSRGFLEKPG
jgi:hypothetical protein